LLQAVTPDGRQAVGTQPRVSLITLVVPDLGEARRFYDDGPGWQSTLDVPRRSR
jgi:hypothetical protein